jgi:hypothetical protein
MIKQPKISEFLHDARRFILKNRQIADTAALQLTLQDSCLLQNPRKFEAYLIKRDLAGYVNYPKSTRLGVQRYRPSRAIPVGLSLSPSRRTAGC